MKVAPFRALTHFIDGFPGIVSQNGRNEDRPFQGIDTSQLSHVYFLPCLGRNEGRPFQGIDTKIVLIFHYFLYW